MTEKLERKREKSHKNKGTRKKKGNFEKIRKWWKECQKEIKEKSKK